MAREEPHRTNFMKAAFFAALCVLISVATFSSCAQPVKADGSTTVELFISTEDGVVRIFSNGTKQVIQGVKSVNSVELYDGKLYVNKDGCNISVYNTDGAYVKNISIPPAVSFLTFVVLPNERIAFMDNENDKVYFVNSSGGLMATTNILDAPDTHGQNLDGVVVNNSLILCEDGNRNILQIDLTTYQVSVFKNLSFIPSWLGRIAYSNGYYYVSGPASIYKFSESGNVTKVAETPTTNIVGLTVIDDYAYVAVNTGGKVYRINLQDGNSMLIASGLKYPDDLEAIAIVAPSASGIDAMWYVAIGIMAVAIAAGGIYYLRRK